MHLKDGTLGGRFFSPALNPVNGHLSAAARDASRILEPAEALD
jgi:hypothetical protein